MHAAYLCLGGRGRLVLLLPGPVSNNASSPPVPAES